MSRIASRNGVSTQCLDMCAAPGSKTSQLLEVINRSLSAPPFEGQTHPQDHYGLVVANDSDTGAPAVCCVLFCVVLCCAVCCDVRMCAWML